MHKGSIRILGGLLLGALLLSFAVFIYSGVGSRSPWMHQAVLLKFNHRFFLEYRSQNAGRWPVKFADLDSAVADASRSPAEGRWRSAQQEITDEIIIYEVMVEAIDPGWWKDFRHKLQSLFRQEEIIIRALPQQLL